MEIKKQRPRLSHLTAAMSLVYSFFVKRAKQTVFQCDQMGRLSAQYLAV